MGPRRRWKSAAALIAATLPLVCISQVGAETYIAGQFGAGFPEALTGVNVGGSGVDRRSALALDIGLLYGAKLGHHFEHTQWKWLGVEMEVFRTTIDVGQQPRMSTRFGPGVEPGAHMGLVVTAFNFTARYPFEVPKDLKGYWYPYIGGGPALFFADARSQSPHSSFGESQTTTVGFNAQAGVRYMLNQDWGFFFEYKFNQARFSFAGTAEGPINGTFVEHDLVIGVSYHLPP